MVGASKILTVSYGTFSCTLEGFEDSFDTMKAIAEYFRDLAAEDRFFGAEPPSPDAAMLQRIAEREIRKRVEARVDEGGILLRPAIVPGDDLSAEAPRVFAEMPTRTQDEQPQAAPGMRPSDEPETVAAKLARIRAVVENARAAAPAEYSAPFAEAGFKVETPAARQAEGQPGPKSPDPAAEAPEPPFAGPAAEPRATGEDTAPDPVPGTPPHAAPAPAATPVAEATLSDEGDDDTDAGTRARVLAALDPRPATGAAPVAVTAPPTDPVPAQPRARARVLKLKREDVVARWPESPPLPLAATKTATQEHTPDEARLPDALEAELQAELAAVWAEFSATTTRDEAPEAAHDTSAPEDKDGTGAAAAAAAREEVPDEDAQRVDAGHADIALRDSEPPDDEAAQEVRREVDTPLLLDQPLAVERTPPAAPDVQGDETAPLELPTAAQAWPDADDAADAANEEPEAPTRVETALQRIWDETNTKLDGAEQTRRHSSIAHLKAAVAATFAEIKSGAARSAGSEDEHARRPYRQVLAKVVRGERTAGSDAATDEPQRLAPLMLVSEQRVDMPHPFPGETPMAIRPRRVTATDAEDGMATDNPEAESASDQEFSRFLEGYGPTGMADLLEAAATYLQVERGLERFTRPEVLRLAQARLGEGDSREELLQAFAGLLRTGTFRKVRRGEFVLATLAPDGETPEAARRHA
ncbi:hypothetical protein NHN26_10580 [Rhodovulum tesquicola]|uniref:hypothetical protein n=1 Tax=Rhodovulum tesquicola TaxID=540254 RepID=UPI002097FD07|nr:hypothetical protein [Rhodovulum tesquicola]MCO8145672.1 hypothetical protein [Rhodovulum tesquicola]